MIIFNILMDFTYIHTQAHLHMNMYKNTSVLWKCENLKQLMKKIS